tara:strand:+ start:114 stop:323 length:210 start_codon:yes stop_codon:yes gene_type:complete
MADEVDAAAGKSGTGREAEVLASRCGRGKRLNVDHISSQGIGMPCNWMLRLVVAVVRTCGAIGSDSGVR